MTDNIMHLFMSSFVILIFSFARLCSDTSPTFKLGSLEKMYIFPESFVYILDASTLSDICFMTIF